LKIYKQGEHYCFTEGGGSDRTRGAIHRLYYRLTGKRILPVTNKNLATKYGIEIFNLLYRPAETGAVPYDKAARDFIQHCWAQRLRYNTIDRHRCNLRDFAQDKGLSTLGDITVNMIQSHLDSLTCSNRTRNRRLTSINRFCDYCRRMGWLLRNPAQDIDRYQEIDPKIAKFVTEEDFKFILESTDPNFAAIIRVAYHTGRRQGEIYWMWKEAWKPVDLETGTMLFPVNITKSRHPECVPFNSEARQAFEFLKTGQPKPFSASSIICQKFRRMMPRLGLRYRFHDLRVTFSTRLREAGYGDTEVMYFLGQKTPGLAATTYTKHQQRHLRKAINSISR
jgi:integrase